MIERLPFVLKTPSGEQIAGDLRILSSQQVKAVVVILHSLMAFKDWGWFPLAAEEFARAGFAAVSFNFSRNGVGENPDRITDFESFRRNTITRELEDTQSVLNALARGAIGGQVLASRNLVLLGHSRGGGIAIVTAAGDAPVKGLVTWSSVLYV